MNNWDKSISFESANRVPFMIHIPGVTDQGMRSSKFVEMVDIFPTLVELAGFDPLDRCPVPSNDVDKIDIDINIKSVASSHFKYEPKIDQELFSKTELQKG